MSKRQSADEMIKEMEMNYFQTAKFEAIGKGDDYLFQVLCFMGEAVDKLTVANTIAIDSRNDIPQKLKDELSLLVSKCDKLKDKFRESGHDR